MGWPLAGSAGMLWSRAFLHASTSRSKLVSAGSSRYFSRSSVSFAAAAGAAVGGAASSGGASGIAKMELDVDVFASLSGAAAGAADAMPR